MFLIVKKFRLRFIIFKIFYNKNKCCVVFFFINKIGRNKIYWRLWKLGKSFFMLYYVMMLRNFIILLKCYINYVVLFWNLFIEDIDWIEFWMKINIFVEYL